MCFYNTFKESAFLLCNGYVKCMLLFSNVCFEINKIKKNNKMFLKSKIFLIVSKVVSVKAFSNPKSMKENI